MAIKEAEKLSKGMLIHKPGQLGYDFVVAYRLPTKVNNKWVMQGDDWIISK